MLRAADQFGGSSKMVMCPCHSAGIISAENERDLTRFLSGKMLDQAEHAQTIVAANGINNKKNMESRNPDADI